MRDIHTSLNLRHLFAALEVGKRGSVSAAAEPACLSQSAISQGISKLESELGQRLFTRTSKGLFTTELGDIFLERVNRALDWLSCLDSVFARKEKNRQRLFRLLTTTQLKALVAVVEYGSYSLAAKHLNLSQPSLHRALKETESICGRTFFQRSPYGVEPNWHARQAARYSSLYFAELSQGIDELSEYIGDIKGKLRVGSLPLARTSLVPQRVTALLADYPSAQVSITDGPYEEQLHALRHGQLDLIIGALREQAANNDILQVPLFNDSLNIVVRPEHPITSDFGVSTLALQKLGWIVHKEGTPAREAFTNFFIDRGLAPPLNVIECSSLVATRALLLESDRAALLSKKQVEVDVDRGLLAVSPKQLPGTDRVIGITTRKNWKPTRLQDQFIKLVTDEFSQKQP